MKTRYFPMLLIVCWIVNLSLTHASALEAEPRAVMTLNGYWDFLIDPGDLGLDQTWYLEDVFESRVNDMPRWSRKLLRVPGCWEEVVQDYEGVAWYRRSFTVPESWNGQAVRIRFDAVNYIAEVWVNGQVAGYHEGGYTPFELHLEDLLRYGELNTIIVRVTGPAVTVEKSGELRMNESPHWRGAITGGIWQPVALIASYPIYLQDVFVQPDIHTATATIKATVQHRERKNRELTAEVRIREWGGENAVVVEQSVPASMTPGVNIVRIPVALDAPKLWSPEEPNLYVADVVLRDGGAVLDAVSERFGMREFTVRENDFFLNGKRFYLKAGFWEGLYPVTLSYPQDVEMVRKEIRMAKDAGFNTLRPWRKPPPAPILDLADEMGVCIIDCPPIECMRNWPRLMPKTEQRIAHEVEGLVLRDRNHPSVIMWEIFNEIMRPYLTRYKHPMALLARSLDPTRLVVDESGGQFASDGSYAYLPFSSEPAHIQERHRYQPAPIDDSIYRYFETFGSSDTLTIMSEYGYGALPDIPVTMQQYRQQGNPIMPDYRYHALLEKELTALMERLGLYRIWPDLSALCLASQEVAAVANKQQTEAIRLNPNIDGYALHAYTGGDWVLGAGILDVWRNPKKSYQSMQEAQQPVYAALRVTPSNVYAGQPAQFRVTIISDRPVGGCRLRLDIHAPGGKQVYHKTLPVSIGQGIQLLVDERLTLRQGGGYHIARAVLENGGAVVADNTFRFWVMDGSELRAPVRFIAVLEERDSVAPALQQADIQCESWDGVNDALPVFVTTVMAQRRDVFERCVKLFDYVRRGGVAVFLNPPAMSKVYGMQTEPHPSMLVRTGLFPLNLEVTGATGNWCPVNHFVHDHPVFMGLPVNCFMGEAYQNVVARQTLHGTDVVPIAGCVSWELEHDYRGIRNVVGGADLAVVPLGKGNLILSKLRLVENLGKDPVADKVLYNLISFAASLSGSVEPADEKALQKEMDRYLGAFDGWK